MRILLTIAFTLTIVVSYASGDSVFTKSRLSHVAVYHTMGAELQHQSRVSLKSGLQYVVVDDLSSKLDDLSFRLGCPENVTILSYQYMLYTKPVIKPENIKHTDSIRSLQKVMASVQNEIIITDEQLRKVSALIENNFTTPDKKNIISAEVIRLTEYYILKIKELKQKSYELNTKYQDLNNQLIQLTKSIDIPIQTDNSPKGRLIMQVIAENPTTAAFDIYYYTQYAGWLPTYDMRLKTLDQSFVLNFKASVSQQTGLDWEGIPLTLSTQPPATGGKLPSIHPVFLQLYVPELYSVMQQSGAQPLPSLKKDNMMMVSEEAQSPPHVGNYTTLSESLLNITYKIDLPYTIPSNGKAYTISMKEEKVNVAYNHLGIPKVDTDVYFTANLYDWNTLNLLPGAANIIIDNIYMGKSFINTNSQADTLQLSLGKDKRIIQTRTPVKELTSISKKNGSQTSVYTYELTVRNTKNKPIDITIKDQYPVAKDKEIEIKLLESGDAEVNKETGILTWKLTLKPNEEKKIRFSYQTKVPEGKKTRETRN